MDAVLGHSFCPWLVVKDIKVYLEKFPFISEIEFLVFVIRLIMSVLTGCMMS